MNDKINKKMTSIIAITFIAVIGLTSIPPDVDGFQQSAGRPDWELYPGESGTHKWVLYSDSDDEVGTVDISSVSSTLSNGTQFLSFPESVEIEAHGTAIIPIIATIPEDYASPHYYNPDGESYVGRISAYAPNVLEGGGVNIKISMSILTPITVLPHYCGQPESFYNNTIIGTDSSDYLVGTKLSDLIFGNGGNDFIRGSQGNDCIFGGEGNDFIQGGAGNDTIYAGNGDDHMRTGAGDDTVHGEDGDDVLLGVSAKGINTFDGGTGFDMCVSQNDKVILNNTNCEITTPTNPIQ